MKFSFISRYSRARRFFFINGRNEVLHTSADNRILWPTDCFQNSVVRCWWWAQRWTRSPLKCNEYTNHTSWWSSISQAIKLTATNSSYTIGSESLKHTKIFEMSRWWRKRQRQRQWRRREKEKWTKAGSVLCAPERGEMKMKITKLRIKFGLVGSLNMLPIAWHYSGGIVGSISFYLNSLPHHMPVGGFFSPPSLRGL